MLKVPGLGRVALRVSHFIAAFLFFNLLFIAYNTHVLHLLREERWTLPTLPSTSTSIPPEDRRPVAWIDGHGENVEKGYLSHVFTVFQRLGYKTITGEQKLGTAWDVLWVHEYPFRRDRYKGHIEAAQPFQRINHIGGSGFYTSKVSLATANISTGIPKAFKLPVEKEEFLDYAKDHPDYFWVQKSNAHRNIQIKKISEMDLNKTDSFVQKFVDNPLLIDGKKFDIGIYTVVISLRPLRVYVYDGEALLRFCTLDYQPFDPENIDQYVVGDDYTPIWEVFEAQQSNMFWSSQKLADRPNSFFELSRFDFVVDEDLNANMSPNLSTGHFTQNRLLYEQVLMNVLSLVGIAHHTYGIERARIQEDIEASEMEVSDRDLAVHAEDCAEHCIGNCTTYEICGLCAWCMEPTTRSYLREAYREHIDRRNMRRLSFRGEPYTPEDSLLRIWYEGKCMQDSTWCQ